MPDGQIADNIARIRERIERAARRSGRSPDEITLLAVTKTVDVPSIQEAYAAGIRVFGENYVQESLIKQNSEIAERADLRWHFIGHLQTNKAKDVVGRFSLIQSVDSLQLVKEISKRSVQRGLITDFLLEVKLDPTDTKFGIAPEATLETALQVQEIAGMRLCGLMGMAPYSTDAEDARPYFRQLRQLYEQIPADSRHFLSMGMTGDFETAIEEGATLVRIGTAIFGKRSHT